MNNELNIVLVGSVNAGKSSLINALMGENKAKTSPVGGETKIINLFKYNYNINGLSINVIDTPGMSEANEKERSRMWYDEAKNADLVFFVICSDLTDTEYKALEELYELGKPIILVLNQVDRYTKKQLHEIFFSIDSKVSNMIPHKNFIKVASAPVSSVIKVNKDGSEECIDKYLDSDINTLRERMLDILNKEGHDLKKLNNFLKTYNEKSKKSIEELAELRKKAEIKTEEFATFTAIGVGLNPVPFLDLAGSVFSIGKLVHEIADIYGEPVTEAEVMKLGEQLWSEGKEQLAGVIAANVVGSFVKMIPLIGTLGGAVIQGGSIGYLIYVLGLTCSEYFANGKKWKDNKSMKNTLEHIIKNVDKDTITNKIGKQIKNKINAA
jgi:small GTP-binding protein